MFAAYPAPFVRDAPGSRRKVQQLLWGDFVSEIGARDGEWLHVRGRNENGWLHQDDVQEERLLELNFVDVGQGDGCFIVTPRDRFILVDAGVGANMYRFLRWRFNLRGHAGRRIHFEHAIITHSDADHYGGFTRIFASRNFTFGRLHHNGIVERTGSDSLGPRERDGRLSYLTDIVADRQRLEQITGDPALVGRKLYPSLLRDALAGGRVDDARMLCADDGFLTGYDGGDMTIQVLAPVPEPDAQGRPRLRWFGDEGQTKNGHSIVLLLRYRDVRMLLGGDLNSRAENYLLEHHAGADPEAAGGAVEDVIAAARTVFEADVAKACHHGSGDFTTTFMRAVNPIATVVSSGDDEPYAHPRPDALGAIGRYGRGERPLIFSTELARSTREAITDPQALRARITELFDLRDQAADEAARAAINARIKEALAKIDRSVAVYGMITVRTDGRRVLIAQKLERPRAASREEFDIHLLEPRPPDGLAYVIED